MTKADELLTDLVEAADVVDPPRFNAAVAAARAYLNEKLHEPPPRSLPDDWGALRNQGASPPHAAAEPEKPVAWMYEKGIGRRVFHSYRLLDHGDGWTETPLYASPAAEQRGFHTQLTKEEEAKASELTEEYFKACRNDDHSCSAFDYFCAAVTYGKSRAAVQQPIARALNEHFRADSDENTNEINHGTARGIQREPTAAMMRAAYENRGYTPAECRIIWTAMYDAALKSAEGEK